MRIDRAPVAVTPLLELKIEGPYSGAQFESPSFSSNDSYSPRLISGRLILSSLLAAFA